MSFVILITWFIRYGHVLGAGAWVGGYAVLALVIIPALKKGTNSKLMPIATTTLRLLTYSGVATMLFGLVLITRTRGFPSLISGGEWGGIVIVCILIAVALMGINDGALRPARSHEERGAPKVPFGQSPPSRRRQPQALHGGQEVRMDWVARTQ
jgi:hypothetical protein